ncbi:hypothetical protein CEXT_509271 [Caerostris extrusa]|uniref:Uncharacterized protein n=1 Tax=Caerostris extrusa TaxID=172846 RepID=A0AAV4WY84_CAEEX|nr:hypothetical protein CEXT_509271 [Caerostris extrusa]
MPNLPSVRGTLGQLMRISAPIRMKWDATRTFKINCRFWKIWNRTRGTMDFPTLLKVRVLGNGLQMSYTMTTGDDGPCSELLQQGDILFL